MYCVFSNSGDFDNPCDRRVKWKRLRLFSLLQLFLVVPTLSGTLFMFNVLFPSGRIMEFGTVDIATIYATAYNGTLLPQVGLDNAGTTEYNACVVNDMENL